MASPNNTPKYFTPNQYAVAPSTLPRRGSITPSVRPSTSGGETIEPKSDFLREALRERKGLPPRSNSTTPRKVKSDRPPVSQLAHDELFLPSSDEESRIPVRRTLFRPQRTRRASDITPAKSSPPCSQQRNLTVRETDAQMDKLLKANWDLKHRIMLHDAAHSKLRGELAAALEELDRTASLRERNEHLQDAINAVSRQAAVHEEENRDLKINNAELTVLNDDLVRELEAKDEGIQQRQLAIEEAAGIIQQLEEANDVLKKQQQALSPPPESDYFSGDASTTPSMKMSLRPTTAGTWGTEHTNQPDSDYFSADSPSLTPVTPKRAPSNLQTKEKAMQLDRAKAMGAAFNREIGLRSQVSKDSLLSTFLNNPPPEANQRRRRTPTQASRLPPRGSIREDPLRAGTPPWSTARGLQAIYEDGGLHRRINAMDELRRQSGYTPSVTVASMSRVVSVEDMYSFSEPNAAPANSSIPTRSSPTTTLSDSNTSLPAPKSSVTSRANLTPVNYSAWPRKLPDWPPSAGLRNRDILFHGAGLDEMFPDSSPPRPSSSREGSFSNVLLMRPNIGRSSTVGPGANAIAPPPPPPPPPQAEISISQPTALGRMWGSIHKKGLSISGPRRPTGLERSQTLPMHGRRQS